MLMPWNDSSVPLAVDGKIMARLQLSTEGESTVSVYIFNQSCVEHPDIVATLFIHMHLVYLEPENI